MATRRRPARKSPRTLAAARATAALLTVREARRRMEIRQVEMDLQEALFAKIDRLEQAAKRRGSRQRLQVARRAHFHTHPLDELGPTGKPLSAEQRAEMMHREQRIRPERSAMTKWLIAERKLARADR